MKILTVSEYQREKKKAALPDVSGTVREIISAVRERGDEAVREYSQKFDGQEMSDIEVTQDEVREAVNEVGEEYMQMLGNVAHNLREFHRRQYHEGFMYTPKPGIIMGQRVIPLERVGIYAPGGKAAYPSSVMMNAIPAEIAGVGEIIMASPNTSPELLAAAYVSGVGRIFRAGGAQAVAAMAFGTSSIPRVDKITGPGNIYVSEAKRQLFGIVDIDMTAGPSEIVIAADKNNYPQHIAADLLAQAEHDTSAKAILITNSRRFALSVSSALDVQLSKLPRQKIAQQSIDEWGAIIIVKNFYEAADIINSIAPEHLELCVDNPFDYMTNIRNAGSIFIGRYSPEALGDYYAGVNHTLPTMGTARFFSPLSTDDFIKKTQYVYYSERQLDEAADSIAMFAKSEGLDAHANSVIIRRS